MDPAMVNLNAYRGDDWEQELKLWLSPDTPLDLTGATVECSAINEASGAVIDLTVTVDADPTTGTITLSLPVDNASHGTFRYDVEVTKDSKATTWIYGLLYIEKDVTNTL